MNEYMDSKLRRIEKILIFLSVLIFNSCAWLDCEVFKEYSLNSEYKITYAKCKNEKINAVSLKGLNGKGIMAVE